MNHLLNLIKKELRELLTPATIIPMLMMLMIFAAMGPLFSSTIDDLAAPSKIGILNADEPNSTDYSSGAVADLEEYYREFYGDDLTDHLIFIDESVYGNDDRMIDEMKENGLTALLVIERDFSDNISSGRSGVLSAYWIQNDGGGLVNISEYSINNAMSIIQTYVINAITGFDVSVVSSENNLIIDGKVYNGYTPSMVSSAVMAQNTFISIIVMLIIIMVGSILISSMGSEKENKTLETLLTLPVGRTTVVGGKIIGSAIVGLIFGAVYLVGMYMGMGRLMNTGTIDLSKLGLSLSMTDWLIVGGLLFMSILAALGICMILGAFAKNYKAAQTLILPVSIMAIIPMLLNMTGSIGSMSGTIQIVMFAIPFSHPMMAISNLMFGDMTMIVAGFVYLSIFSLITLYITVRLYRSDILITGFIKKDRKRTLFSRK